MKTALFDATAFVGSALLDEALRSGLSVCLNRQFSILMSRWSNQVDNHS